MDDSSPSTLANVTVLVTGEDGSTSVRNTYFVYEDGIWKHRFGPEEYEILANAPSGSASVSASASASASATVSASSTASSSPSPNPSPNRNDDALGNGHRRAGAGEAKPIAPRGGGDIACDEVDGPIPVPPGDPNNLDRDNDGLACEE